jgi:hypothetical protein
VWTLRAGVPVRFVRSVFVLEDDACFYLGHAASAGTVGQAAEQAGAALSPIHLAVERAQPDGQERHTT